MGLKHQDTQVKISLCKNCNGIGTVEHSELQDYHRGEYRYWNTVCHQCKGTGRLKTITNTITETIPYDNPEVSLLLLKETEDK